MAHCFQTHHLRCVAMSYLLEAKGDITKLEGFSDLSPEILDEFKKGGLYEEKFFLQKEGIVES